MSEKEKTLDDYIREYTSYDPNFYDDEGNYIGGSYKAPQFRIEEGSEAYNARLEAERHRATMPTYTSSYTEDINRILGSINNREGFSYDVNADAIYNQYKDKYLTQGKLASEDAIGKASAMSGGFGNSYAATVGNQAYLSEVGKLNDIIPELYEAAYGRYNKETQDLYDKLAIYKNAEDSEYAKYRDKYSDWQYNQGVLDSAADSEYKKAWDQYVVDTDTDQKQFNEDRDFAADAVERGYDRALIESGISPETVSSLSVEEIMDIYSALSDYAYDAIGADGTVGDASRFDAFIDFLVSTGKIAETDAQNIIRTFFPEG